MKFLAQFKTFQSGDLNSFIIIYLNFNESIYVSELIIKGAK